jgi:hypothetical protein
MGHVIRIQLRGPESTQSDFRKDTILGHVNYESSTAEKQTGPGSTF